jgi:hypothetical protein
MRSPLLLLIWALLVQTAAAQTGNYTVQGRVIDRDSRSPVAGATVQLLGFGRVISGSDGTFRFSGVPEGRLRINAQMLGYEQRDVTVNVRADVTVTIELEVEPISMDTLVVGARSINIRGRVVEKGTGKPIEHAFASIRPTFETRTRADGSFRLKKVPAGREVSVSIAALMFMPAGTRFETDRDTMLIFELEPDPVGRKMVAMQLEKLEKRTRGLPYTRKQFERAELEQIPGDMEAFIQFRLTTYRYSNRPMPCIYYDDRQIMFKEELASILVSDLYRVELIDRGTMLRMYSRQHIERMLRGRGSTSPVLLIKGMRTICT